jgi:hypothetical protein
MRIAIYSEVWRVDYGLVHKNYDKPIIDDIYGNFKVNKITDIQDLETPPDPGI